MNKSFSPIRSLITSLSTPVSMLILSLMVSLIGIQNTLACGNGRMNSDGTYAKCLPASSLNNAVIANGSINPEALKRELVRLGSVEMLKRCSVDPASTTVTEISGLSCGSGQIANRACAFKANLNCYANNVEFSTAVQGACQGGLHDCGTFDRCFNDQTTSVKNGAFRANNAPAPKSFSPSAAAGGAQ